MNHSLHLMALVVAIPTWALAEVKPFDDVTVAMGLEGMRADMASWVDYDNDGWVDLYTLGQLWRNVNGQSFVPAPVAVPPVGPGIWADFNNDGYTDYFTWHHGGRVYQNLQGKDFEDLGDRFPGIPPEVIVSLGAAWGDFDGDGLADLYVGGYESWERGEIYHDLVFRNRGDGTFKPARYLPGNPQPARGVTAADYDRDGDLDVYVSNYRLVPNRLWQNDGEATFHDVAQEAGVAGDGDLGAWGHTIGSCWGDLNNDGLLDLFVVNFSHPPEYQDRPKFLKNLGPTRGYAFENLSASAGLHWQESYASPTLGDFDNDGHLDLFFTTVYPGDASVLYRNRSDWRFENVTAPSAISTRETYQAAWGDFNNDGYLDLVSGGKLYRNPGGDHSWLKVHVRGGQGVDGSALGTQVSLQVGNQTLTRQVESATGQGNQNQLTLHFGLGKHTGPLTLHIRWIDGKEQTMVGQPKSLIVVNRE